MALFRFFLDFVNFCRVLVAAAEHLFLANKFILSISLNILRLPSIVNVTREKKT